MSPTPWIITGVWFLSFIVCSQTNYAASFFPTCATANRRATIIRDRAFKQGYEEEFDTSRSEAKKSARDDYTRRVCPQRMKKEIGKCDLQQVRPKALEEANQIKIDAIAKAQAAKIRDLRSEIDYCSAVSAANCNSERLCFERNGRCIPRSLAI
ncbi:uncharacterized protein LOC134273383 isoform X2 [Saccostrea cucullata]|uniref:uncharacterized protein LOC134273383 isoform X2 n=1 Tax=Saccostrea cuccullata TaxID=36930 RepID=UPI002ED51F37